jgi:hypothetical protein
VGDQLRGCKSQAAAAQKTANDANKAAAAAAKTLSATQGDVKALKREITLLHGKLKSLQPSENIADAATKVKAMLYCVPACIMWAQPT